MKTTSLRKYALLLMTAAYSHFFWEEKLGINLLLFSVFLILILLWDHREAIRSNAVRLTLCGTLLTAAMVVYNNSAWSKFAHITSLLLLAGFIHQPVLRSISFSIWQVMVNYGSSIRMIWNDFVRKTERRDTRAGRILYYVRITLLPLLFLIVFYVLFLGANPKFADFSSRIWTSFFSWLGNIFEHVSFTRIFFTLSGAFICGGMLYHKMLAAIPEKEGRLNDFLLRVRRKMRPDRNIFEEEPFRLSALKTEYNAAVILVVMVNILVLVVNIIDINWIWIDFEVPETMVLKHFVHGGTYLLIISILLSMGIILYFFRANINFYKKNTFLKNLCYVWMFQNVILVISVCLRNYYYLHTHGLAYKRLGVYFFLALTLFGLLTMVVKLAKTRSSFYMIRMNSWGAYVLMILISTIDWDVVMAKYNLNHWNKKGIDSDFYFTFSPKVMPLVYENLETVKLQIEANKQAAHRWMIYQDFEKFKNDLDARRLRYLDDQNHFSWLSWNISDSRTVEKLADGEPRLSQR